MIDFETIVRSVLLIENTTTVPPTSTVSTTMPPPSATSSTDTDKDSFNAFLTQQRYKELQNIWTTKYKDYPFISLEETKMIAYVAMENSKRKTKDPGAFPKIKNIFPLLDLFAGLGKNFQKGGNAAAAPVYFDTFIKRIKEDKSNIPLDYNPLEPWTHTVKGEYYSDTKNDIGKLRIETLNPNATFYYTIYNLLAIRKNGLNKKLPDQDKNITTESFIDTILLNIANIINGTVPVRDEKIKKVYDEGACRALMSVASAAYQLYKQQIETIVGSLEDQTNKTEAQALFKDNAKFIQFMGKNDKSGAQKFIWKTPEIITTSFDQSFELLCRQMLDESKTSIVTRKVDNIDYEVSWNKSNDQFIIKNKTTDKIIYQDNSNALSDTMKLVRALGKFNNSIFNIKDLYDNKQYGLEDFIRFCLRNKQKARARKKSTKTGPASANASSEPNEPDNTKQPFQIQPNAKEYMYSLGKLKEATSMNLPTATNLMSALEELANYIRKQQEFYWAAALDAIGKIAHAGMLGTKAEGF